MYKSSRKSKEKRLAVLEERFKIIDKDAIGRKIGEFFKKHGEEGIDTFFNFLENGLDSISPDEMRKLKASGAIKELLEFDELVKEIKEKKCKLREL